MESVEVFEMRTYSRQKQPPVMCRTRVSKEGETAWGSDGSEIRPNHLGYRKMVDFVG